MDAPHAPASRFRPPPRQHNLDTAADLAAEALRRQIPSQCQWLGAAWADGHWRLPVLEAEVAVGPADGSVTTSMGAAASAQWRILVLHYLAVAGQPAAMEPTIAFADLAGGRTYASIYARRISDRLCATAGRDARMLWAHAASLGARRVEAGDVGFDLRPFPRLPVRVVWHAPDEEFPPSVTMLFPENVELWLPIEDVVVLSERLVSRLGGRPF